MPPETARWLPFGSLSPAVNAAATARPTSVGSPACMTRAARSIGSANPRPPFGNGCGAFIVRKFWKNIGACTKVWRGKPAASTTSSTRALSVKCATLRRPPLILSQSGSVDQTRCFTPAECAARTAAVPISVSRCICAGSQKFVTTKAPYAPSNGKRRLGASSKSPLMTSTPRLLSALAAAPTGSRLTTRTANWPDASNASTTPPPCLPLPPITAIIGFAIVCSPFTGVLSRGTDQYRIKFLSRNCHRETAEAAYPAADQKRNFLMDSDTENKYKDATNREMLPAITCSLNCT